MRRLDIRWMMFAAVATLTPACTYILGLEGDVGSLPSGTGGAGGMPVTTTMTSSGGGGQGGNPGCGPGQDNCGSGCVDIDTPQNCGMCGRNCNGDTCVAGLCAVTTIGATTAPGPTSAVAVDMTYVYWADRVGGQVMRSGLDGSSATPLVTGRVGLDDIEVSGGKLYWTSGTNVGVVNIGGGGETPLATGEQGASGITVHMDFAYWANNGNSFIRGAPGDGMMAASNQITAQQSAPAVIVNDGVNLYWTNTPSDGEIMMAPIGTDQPVLLVDQVGPRELAVSGGFLYWVRQIDNSVVRMSAMPMQQVVTIVSGLGRPQGLAVDGEDVYFTIKEGQICEVMRAQVNGTGTPLKLADGCTDSPFGVAVDATHVYWSNIDDNAVKKVAR